MAFISVQTKQAARVVAWNAAYNKRGQDVTDAAADAVMELVKEKLDELERLIRERDVVLPVRMEL